MSTVSAPVGVRSGRRLAGRFGSLVLALVLGVAGVVGVAVRPAVAEPTEPATFGSVKPTRMTDIREKAGVTASEPVAASSAVAAATDPGTYVSLEPARILDTREAADITAGQPVPANGVVSLQVANRGGVPAGAGAVVLNVTVTLPASTGFVTVYPSGEDEPWVSNLNFTAGQTVPNLVVVKVGSDGKVNLKVTSSGTVHLIADVSGYFLGGEPTVAGAFKSLTPSRILDTREAADITAGAPVPANGVLPLQVTGRSGVPAGATAVVLNVTVTLPAANGFVTVYPSGTDEPWVSNLNFTSGLTVPNLVVVQVGSDGKVNLKVTSPGTVHLIADVSGYFLEGDPTVTGAFVSIEPVRLFDTREDEEPIPAWYEVCYGEFDSEIDALVMNVTVTEPTSQGFIIVHPSETDVPNVSNLNFMANQTVPNLVNVKVGTDGYVCFANGSEGYTHLIADVAGYFLAAPPPAPVISSISPTGGSTAGGTVVTINGTNLSGASKVTFGTVDGTNLTVVSDTQITVTAPAHDAGTVDVTVTTRGGVSAASSFTYVTSRVAQQVDSGGQHTCALTSTGGVTCWGANFYGQLGDNTTTDKQAPVDVVGLNTGIQAVATGNLHTCALTSTGGVKCWGWNGICQVK